MRNDGAALEVGARLSHWLRQAYPRDAAKHLARDFSCSPHTAKKWLAGMLPENRTMARMVARWGKNFLAFIYEPVVGPWRGYALDEELRDLKDRLARLEDDLDETRADPGRDSPVPAMDAYPPGSVARAPGGAVAGSLAPLDGTDR